MKKYLVILKKELKSYFRDKRSLVMMLIPLLLFPVLIYASNQQAQSAQDAIADCISISTNSQENIAELVETLTLSGINVDIVQTENPYDELKTGKIALIIEKNAEGYAMVYDQNSAKSTMALGVITNCIETQKNAYILSIFNQCGESVDNLNNYAYNYQDVSAVDESESNSFLAILAPTMLIMFIASGASSVAVDLFCGEKERGSLEGILATQVSRKSLYFAKVSTVLVFSCISTIISVVGYMISFSFDNSMMYGTSLKMSILQIFSFLAITLSFALFSSATISVLSVEAKTVKEGNMRTSLFSIIPSMISIVTMYMETGNMNFGINLVPFINTIVALKSVFLDVIDPINILVSVSSTLIYSVVLLFVGYKIMNSEKILNK